MRSYESHKFNIHVSTKNVQVLISTYPLQMVYTCATGSIKHIPKVKSLRQKIFIYYFGNVFFHFRPLWADPYRPNLDFPSRPRQSPMANIFMFLTAYRSSLPVRKVQHKRFDA